MSTSFCCRPLSLPPTSLSHPSVSRVTVLNRPTLRLSLSRTSTHLRFQSRLPTNKWRFLCYRDKNFSSEIPGSELEDKLSEDLVTPKCEQSKDLKKDWLSSIHKKWRFLCYRDEKFSSEIPGSELIEDKPSEDLVTPKCDQSKDLKKDWLSSISKGTDVVLGVEPWTVPWTAKTIVQVMLLWIASFWLVGSWIVPFLAYTAGFRKESLTYRGQALYSLLTDVAEGIVGIAILHRCLANFQPLSSDWFKFRLKGKWPFDVGLGCLMFPLINQLSQMNLNLLPIFPSTPVTISNVEQSIVARDPVAMALYAVVVSVCAPIWEEIVFRGFLLPSLTKYMPVWCAILVSSVAFALAHFNLQRMLPLVFLGMVMGAVFVRSRNLLPSMLLHSLWNAFVFLDLMK